MQEVVAGPDGAILDVQDDAVGPDAAILDVQDDVVAAAGGSAPCGTVPSTPDGLISAL